MKEFSNDLSEYKEKMETIMKEREKKVKTGQNVIHLSYLSQHISSADLAELESDVAALGLELSSMDKSGIPFNSISSVSADVVLLLTAPGIVGAMLSGLLNSTLYDGLKAIIIKCWQKVNGRQTLTISSNTAMESPAKFHLVIKLDEKRSVELKTENLDKQSLVTAIGKIGEIADSLKSEGRSLLAFDSEQVKWKPIELTIDYLKQPEKYTRVMPLEEYLEEMKELNRKS